MLRHRQFERADGNASDQPANQRCGGQELLRIGGRVLPACGEQEIVGQWGGKASDRLDLVGEVLRQHFERLCDNRHPFTGEQLTARYAERPPGGLRFYFRCQQERFHPLRHHR